jgi:ATP-dependent Clp protease, protease subunit
MDDERCEAILRANVNLTQEQWAVHKSSDLWLRAEEAVSAGLATQIDDFAPPIGSMINNVFA